MIPSLSQAQRLNSDMTGRILIVQDLDLQKCQFPQEQLLILLILLLFRAQIQAMTHAGLIYMGMMLMTLLPFQQPVTFREEHLQQTIPLGK
jgi:hypothetical protein